MSNEAETSRHLSSPGTSEANPDRWISVPCPGSTPAPLGMWHLSQQVPSAASEVILPSPHKTHWKQTSCNHDEALVTQTLSTPAAGEAESITVKSG